MKYTDGLMVGDIANTELDCSVISQKKNGLEGWGIVSGKKKKIIQNLGSCTYVPTPRIDFALQEVIS